MTSGKKKRIELQKQFLAMAHRRMERGDGDKNDGYYLLLGDREESGVRKKDGYQVLLMS